MQDRNLIEGRKAMAEKRINRQWELVQNPDRGRMRVEDRPEKLRTSP